MKHFNLAFLLLFALPFYAHAQYSESITTDRPGLTFSPYTLGKKVVQIQSGYNISGTEFKDIDSQSNGWLFTNFLRVGLSEHFDIEAVIDLQSDRVKVNSVDVDSLRLKGISNTQLGIRYNYTKNDGWVPAFGFQGRLLLRAVSNDYKREKVGMVFNFMTSNQINSWLSYNMNIGAYLPNTGNNDYTLPSTFNFGITINDKFGTFVEMFGNLNNFKPGVDTGLSYLVSNNFMLDIGGGITPTKDSNTWFTEIGLSYRFDWRNGTETDNRPNSEIIRAFD
ncbi:transporter [Flammeovirga sp. SubArs3]|uniref:transporter n=1 Tax=Flammeovirga sp. SubArs3 TaxID=2995316 RepID=UPI00248B5184|nr:transporter [Flammeovirga sp. SubArs3]